MDPDKLTTSLALKSIAYGFCLPEGPISRINELNILKNLMKSRKFDCVLDVGANRGQFAYELRGIGYKSHIISFEPLSKEFKVLSNLFKTDSMWTGYNFALGEKSETKEINVHDHSVFSSFLKSNNKEKNLKKEIVQVKKLDDIFYDIIKPLNVNNIFLKMDTQGYDVHVFNGAKSIISNIYGIQSELSVIPYYKGMPSYIEAISTYERSGFRLFNLVVEARNNLDAIMELNCIMTRP